jgi:hypothetical protein
MAEKKQEESKITPAPEDSGVSTQPVKPITEVGKDEQTDRLVHPEDVKKGVLNEPEHEADQTPYPVGEQPPQERPPFSTGRPDVPIVQSAVTGAGAHTPPDPEQFKPDGRPRLEGIND